MKKKTISYIIVGENPLSGILKSQLYRTYQDLEIFSSINVIFLINPLLWLRIRKDVVILQNSMTGVTLYMVPFQLIPERYMRLGVFLTVIGNAWNLFIFRFLKRIGLLVSDIIVGRSYYAGHVLAKIKLSDSLKVFDPRSIYPLERYSNGYIRSFQVYNFWLSWERNMINNFDSVISVSGGMTKYYNKLNNRVIEVFLNSGMKVRSELNNRPISKNLNLVYWGSLVYANHNNSWKHYEKRLKELGSSLECSVEVDFFLPRVDSRIKNTKYCGKVKLNFFQGIESLNVSKYHAAIYFIPESLDSFSRLGIKTVEYLSQNLPIIFDSGMSDFVKDLVISNNAGFLLKNFQIKHLINVKDNPLRVYNENFCSKISQDNLRELYADFSTES